jgi:cyclic pyranopterin phosphate synthase
MDAVVPSGEVLARLGGEAGAAAFTALGANYRGEVAARHVGTQGHEVGLISSVTAPFCGDCSRARLSAVGALYTCLFAGSGTDLRAPLRAGATDADLRDLVAGVWGARRDRYSEERGEVTRAGAGAKVEMSHIGG